ncbi:hypothetical protein ACP275_04G073400 [Erythranthe tilingii]
MASSLVSAQTTAILRNPLSDRRIAAFSPNSYRLPALPYSHRRIALSKPSKSITACSVNPPESNQYPVRDTLSGSTRTFATIGAVALAASKVIAPHGGRLFTLAVQVKEPVVKSAGPAFFAAVRRSELRSLNTPLTVVAAGMAKWLDLYSGILTVRCMLSWFPNIQWDKQPLSAIRDLCDPYLGLFRNIIPPIGGVLDPASLLALAVLGALGSILKGAGA